MRGLQICIWQVLACSLYIDLESLGEGSPELHLTDIGAQLTYRPGTLVFLTGRVLEHEVPEWEGGEKSGDYALYEGPCPQ